jgi:hypothetical protein
MMTTNDEDQPTPSQVLAMTIKKKRRILRSRDRNLRLEILLTSTIRRLCQEIGDHLRARRTIKRKSTMDQDASTVRQSDSNKWTQPLARDEEKKEESNTEKSEKSSPSRKRPRDETFDEKDPFGLDEFFRSFRTCPVGGEGTKQG